MSDRQLIADLLSALEYHTEQTRPIEFSRVAIEAAREYLRKPAQQEHKPWCASLSALMLKPRPCDCKRVPLPTAPGSAARSADSAEPFCKPWVGLNAKDLTEIPPSCFEGAIWADAKLKEKNT